MFYDIFTCKVSREYWGSKISYGFDLPEQGEGRSAWNFLNHDIDSVSNLLYKNM